MGIEIDCWSLSPPVINSDPSNSNSVLHPNHPNNPNNPFNPNYLTHMITL